VTDGNGELPPVMKRLIGPGLCTQIDITRLLNLLSFSSGTTGL